MLLAGHSILECLPPPSSEEFLGPWVLQWLTSLILWVLVSSSGPGLGGRPWEQSWGALVTLLSEGLEESSPLPPLSVAPPVPPLLGAVSCVWA